MKEKDKVVRFLLANGWLLDEYDSKDEYQTYIKEWCYGVDISEDEIVFIDDTGDFLNLPLNYYSLLGVLIHYRQLPLSFKQYTDYKVKIVHRKTATQIRG